MQRRAIDDDLYFEILASERLRVRALMILMGALFTFSLILLMLPRDTLPFFLMVERQVPVGAITSFYGAAFLYEIIVHTALGVIIAKRRHIPEAPRYGNA